MPTNAGDTRDTCLILGLGRYPEGENGNPLHYSCMEISMDRGAWWAIACGALLSHVMSSSLQPHEL